MRRSGDTISTIVGALAAVVLPPGAPAGRQPAAKAGEPASPREPTTDPADKRQTEIRLEDIVDDLEPIGNRQPRARFNNDRGVCGPQGGAKAQEDIEQQTRDVRNKIDRNDAGRSGKTPGRDDIERVRQRRPFANRTHFLFQFIHRCFSTEKRDDEGDPDRCPPP